LTGSPTTNIYYNEGNVGIGTTNPIRRLHIQQTLRIGGVGTVIDFGDDYTTQIYRSGTSQEIRFVTGNVDKRMIIAPTGNVVIGTTQVVERLNVGGSVSLGSYDTHSGSRFVGHLNTTVGNDYPSSLHPYTFLSLSFFLSSLLNQE
jgi:hypothetical protein